MQLSIYDEKSPLITSPFQIGDRITIVDKIESEHGRNSRVLIDDTCVVTFNINSALYRAGKVKTITDIIGIVDLKGDSSSIEFRYKLDNGIIYAPLLIK